MIDFICFIITVVLFLTIGFAIHKKHIKDGTPDVTDQFGNL